MVVDCWLKKSERLGMNERTERERERERSERKCEKNWEAVRRNCV